MSSTNVFICFSKSSAINSLLLIALSTLPVISVADELDTLQFRASVNKSYDDNLFKRSTNEVSEQITRSTMGIKFDKAYSLQRLKFDVWLVDNKYSENDYLDFVGKNYDGSFLWSLTPSLTGSLSSRRTESMNNFGDFLNNAKNVRTQTLNEFKAKYSPHNVWAVIAGVSQNKLENSQTFTAITDFDATGVDYGLSYDFSSGAYVKFLAHNRNGGFQQRPLDSVNAFDNGYSEKEYEIDLFFQQDGKSKVSAKLGHLSRTYDNFSVRDFSSYVGYVNYELILTGKIRSNFSLARTATPYETNNTTYSILDSFRTDVLYDISSKIRVGLNLRYAERDFEGRERFDSSGREDKEKSFGGSISWNPTKNIGLSLLSTRSYRESTVSRFNYDDILTSINLDLKI